MIKVIVVDDEYIVRKGLIATIHWEKFNMEVVADAANGAKGWEQFSEHTPEVVITDIVMPEMNGIELARKIKQKAPDTKILLLSCHRDFEYAMEGIKLGASGYILKTAFQDEEFEEYLAAFSKEIEGKQAENPLHVNQKEGHGAWPEPIQKAVQLITRDLSKSHSSVDIAYEVGLSRSHFSTLFKKSVGESFSDFTERLKLEAACELLESTSLTLQEIGEKIGIQDGKYLSKWFKKCTGETPSEYRQTKRRTDSNKFTPFL
ncbi:response regulator transcription factor [Neobacillus kokaensis]|uniref:DNA-binding response regulator n=1 Tax=Neobacillus kokaensis TaxID=2759023 RepID=A0ABQ3N9T3_9BACI|nr:response regulator [Neobacillus kokaensis]GHH99550.1 DNA-binding response regulator [Neobacillus kokaensis]